MTVNLDFKVTGVIIDALDILCAQLMRDLFATAKFSFPCKAVWQLSDWNTPNGGSHHTEGIKKLHVAICRSKSQVRGHVFRLYSPATN